MKISKKLVIMFIGSATLIPFRAMSQESNPVEMSDTVAELIIPPLFEYPVAPDDLPDLRSRTNYVMENFWQPFDFTQSVVDQNALNHAFGVYTGSMPYADAEIVLDSSKKLIEKIKDNPGLTYQFTKAAEENLYGPRAEMWIDQIYLMFLDNLVRNKKIDDIKKAKYIEQDRILRATQPDQPLPQLKYTKKDGWKVTFKPSKDYTIIEFGNPECHDCHLAQFQFEISASVNNMIDDGILDVAFFIPEDEDGELLKKTESFPEKWIVGKAEDAYDFFDIRATPTIYVIDKNGKIIAKNVAAETAIGIVEESIKLNQNK